MRVRRLVMTGAAAVVLLASACGSRGADEGGVQRLKGQRLEVAAVWSGEEQVNFEKVLRRFERRTGAEVRFTSTGRNIATVLGSRIEGGDSPDVALLPQPGLLGDLARSGALEPIEPVAGPLVGANYAPVWRELGSVDGTLYGVWFKAANKSTVWYRTKAFFDAGVAPPKTWEKFQEVSARLADKGLVPLAIGANDGWTLTDWFENVYLRTAGAQSYERLSKGQLPWTDASVKRALRRLSEIFGRPDWLAGEPAETDFEESVRQVFADPPQAAMVYEGDFVASAIANIGKAKSGEGAQSFDFPAIADSKPALQGGRGARARPLVAGGDVAVLFTDNRAAKQLIRFLATPEAAEPWARSGGFVSPNSNVDPHAYKDTTSQRAAGALANSPVVFDLSDQQPPAFGAIEGQGMREILRKYLTSPVTSPAAVDAVAQRLEEAGTAAKRCERETGGQC